MCWQEGGLLQIFGKRHIYTHIFFCPSQTGCITYRNSPQNPTPLTPPPFFSSYPRKPAIHQFAEASYLDQHGVCLNMVALDKVMEWQPHTNAIRLSPHLIKPHNDITQAFRLLIGAVGKPLSLCVCLALFTLPVLLLCFLFPSLALSLFLPLFCDVSPWAVVVQVCVRVCD